MGLPQLVQTSPNSQINAFDPDQVSLIKATIAKNATDDELRLFLYHATKAGLDPLAKQIYFIKYGSSAAPTFITSIDGYRLTAARTGEYVGCDDAVFDNELKPSKATLTVYRFVKGIRCAFTATARWSEYYPGKNRGNMWDKMPCTMLAKVAEALALRKAFPAELSGLYTKEEMDQAEEYQSPSPTMEKSEAAPKQAEAPPKLRDTNASKETITQTSSGDPVKSVTVEIYKNTPEQMERLRVFSDNAGLNFARYGDEFNDFMADRPITELREACWHFLQRQAADAKNETGDDPTWGV
ncbi:MAG: phage recombination protein Bet [Pseudobdellovibrionaceae bacterium]|nr:phage recombination protein Bet [Pseudobdellovibrionaceae bacterium]